MHDRKDPFVQRFVKDAMTCSNVKYKLLMLCDLSLGEYK
jgi:hypothetical protein